jgi:hypothetical protein
MKLAFRNKIFGGYRDKEVPIELRIGTFEDIKASKGIDFDDMGKMMKDDLDKFMVILLYYGYLTACQKSYKKPKYGESKAYVWYAKMDQEARKEINNKMMILFGEMKGLGSKKKVKAK